MYIYIYVYERKENGKKTVPSARVSRVQKAIVGLVREREANISRMRASLSLAKCE